jgi:hypothetical protein
MMHPAISETIMRHNQRELERSVRSASVLRQRRQLPAGRPSEPVLLRLCTVHDGKALARLAALDGAPVPSGGCILAEIGGEVVAALPLGRGRAIADPFRPTAHVLHLLELRAGQLAEAKPPRRRNPFRGAIRVLSRA